jgi:hypothetical protein
MPAVVDDTPLDACVRLIAFLKRRMPATLAITTARQEPAAAGAIL